MKRILTIILACFAISAVRAQEYKVAKSSGRLEIKEVNHVTIEGYTGNEIIFSTKGGKADRDERASGLRSVNREGLEDNTGIGLSVQDKGDKIEVQQMKRTDGPEVTIKVPKGVVVSYQHSSPYGGEVEFKNVEGEIEVSTVHNRVTLDNVSGPMTIKTVHGDIDASLSANIKAPVSIVSVHGHVDVALPLAIKATMRLGTVYGEIFVDPAFKLEIEGANAGTLKKYSSDNFTGKINGGGLEINLNSTHNNIYLRKK
ncbi:MAG: DUF4097 family beta strand repeat-containing protein [Chryseolinea sp.]